VKATVETTMQQARRMSAPRAIALCQCFNGALEFQAGNWVEAERALRESIQLYREIGAASGEALACQRLGVLLTAQKRLDEAMAVMQEGVMAAEHALMRAHCLTRLYAAMARNRLQAGDEAAARQALMLGLDMSGRHGHCTTCDALLLPVAISVSITQGKLTAAESFCQRLDAAATEYTSHTWVALARQAQGELAAAQGDVAGALSCYQSAYQGFKASNYDYEAARCLTAVAQLHQHLHHVQEAHAAQKEADQIFAQLGAPT
jgi:predicted negative regulator of RcsB-dependent stress response